MFSFRPECLVELKEYSLARSFLPEPQREVERFAAIFKLDMGSMPAAEWEMLQEGFVGSYAKSVSLILQMLVGLGEGEHADKVLNYALNCVPNPQLRDQVMERLSPCPPSTRIH